MSRHNSDGSTFTCLDECQPGTSYTEVVRMLEDRIVALEEAAEFEQFLRDKHPGLQALWDEYQMYKQLVIK